MDEKVLVISPSPHLKDKTTASWLMRQVIYALIPATLVSGYYFGIKALIVLLVSILSCLLFEYVVQKYAFKTTPTLSDGSALVTGWLLAFNLPSSLPLWMVVIGAGVAMGVGKLSFGGLGKNPFNPALVGRVFLLISYPVEMTLWPKPSVLSLSLVDGVTGATALGILKEGVRAGKDVGGLLPAYYDLFIGQMGGSLGEVSALALILGGVYLLYKKVITWHIPLSFIASALLFATLFWSMDSNKYADPLFHLCTGGMLLGAFFMATDYVTSPMSNRGMIVFGIGCGIITMLIRMFGAYPEGVSFAILLMNATVPLIDRYMKPKVFGVTR